MQNRKLRVLVVASDSGWRERCAKAFESEGCDVRHMAGALEALDLLHRFLFDVIVADDSCADMAPAEFMLNVRDMAHNEPLILLGGHDLERFGYVWRHWNVFFAGPKNDLFEAIPQSVRKVSSLFATRFRAQERPS